LREVNSWCSLSAAPGAALSPMLVFEDDLDERILLGLNHLLFGSQPFSPAADPSGGEDCLLESRRENSA
jgi:hypothetical protein